jgi:Ran-binding protein 1
MLDKGTGEKQWLEKGKGDVKILKHKENDRIRILMRQEKTLKIICNHFIDPRIIMKPMPQSEKSKIWVAYDFSDGEKLVETTFCIKFNTPEIANEFQKAFESAQTHNKKIMSGADTAESTEEVDQLAKEIEKKAEVKEDAEEQKPKE